MSPALLRRQLTKLIWGLLLATFDFNLNTLDILPDCVGWFLLASGVKGLGPVLPQLPLLYPLAAAMGAVSVPEEVLQLFGADLWEALPGFLSPAVSLVLQVISIYFFFQLFTDLATLAARLQPEGRRLDRAMRWQRNAHAVLNTAAALVPPSLLQQFENNVAAVVALTGYVLFLVIWGLWCLVSLRAMVPAEGAPAEDAPAPPPGPGTP